MNRLTALFAPLLATAALTLPGIGVAAKFGLPDELRRRVYTYASIVYGN
jgi:hypothetical protein